MIKEKICYIKRTTTIAVAAGVVKSVRFVSAKKTGYRVMKEDKIGIYGATGNAEDEEGFLQAEKNLDNQIPYPVSPETDCLPAVDKTPKLLSDKEFVSACENLLFKFKKACPKFIFANNIQKIEFSHQLENDAGCFRAYKTGYYVISLSIKEESSANVFDLAYSYKGKMFDIEKMTADVKKLYEAYYIPVEIEEGERYILSDIFTLGGRKLFRDVSADVYANGTGLFAGKEGEQVFNEALTVYENRDPDSCSSACFFDDEGVVPENKRNVIFDHGAFVAPIACKTDAQKYHLKRAGFASSPYDGAPQTGLDNVEVQSSGKTIEELLHGKDGIYIVMASGGDTTPDGNFATPVQVSFLVKNGELVGRLPELNISGNVFAIYGKNYVGQASNSLFTADSEEDKPMIVKMQVKK